MKSSSYNNQYTHYYVLVYVNNYNEVRCRLLNCNLLDEARDIARALGIKNIIILSSVENIVKKLNK